MVTCSGTSAKGCRHEGLLRIFYLCDGLRILCMPPEQMFGRSTPPSDGSYNPNIRPIERFWVDQQLFLLSRGYKLRPRYDPAWIPSWTLPGSKCTIAGLCEDGHGAYVCALALALLVAHGYCVETKGDGCNSNEGWCQSCLKVYSRL